jgi:glycosyltransferase involved in cell wall biosynthesis
VVNGGNCLLPATNWVHYVHAAYRPHVAGRGLRAVKARAWRPVWVAAERAALRMARTIIANSDVTRRHVVELCGVDADRVRTVYYGVDRERFRPATPEARRVALAALGWSDDRPRVAFIGGLGDRRKGFDILFEAWQELRRRKRDWDVQLVVVGTGAELPAWRARASAAGLADHVLFLGFRKDVPLVLAACDALAAPTRYEAYGLGVHEALCCGLPAFVSSTSGIAERYPRALADLLLPEDLSVASVTDRLLAWREDPERLRLLVRPFAEQLRSRTWDDMADDLAALA